MLHRQRIESAADLATRELFEAIISGRLAPSAPLRLKDLSEHLGMSMMPVREALSRLSALGLIESEPHKGARVRALTLSDLEDTYFTRLHLETIAIWEAAKRFTADDGARAAAALAERDEAQRVGDRVRARDAHERFHFSIYEASGRSSLVRAILPGWRNAERYRERSIDRPDVPAERAREHAQILAALIRGDGDDAVRWMTIHLTSSVRLAAQSLVADSSGTDHDAADASLELPGIGALLSRLHSHSQ